MFPTYRDDKNEFMQEKHRRRARNDPHNRDFICPCGKSYLSYPALFTHIKQKHNGRAPGQIIKPKPENGRGRGRPKQRQNYDSQSETQDEAANVIGNLCDYITEIERQGPHDLKRHYSSSDFYFIYAAYKQTHPKFNPNEDLYEETIDLVLCEFLSEISQRYLQPFLFDEMFTFIMFLTKALNELNFLQGQVQYIKRQGAKNIVYGFNLFILDYLPKYIQQYNLQKKQFLILKHVMKILQYLYSWLINKKYSKDRLKRNPQMVIPGLTDEQKEQIEGNKENQQIEMIQQS